MRANPLTVSTVYNTESFIKNENQRTMPHSFNKIWIHAIWSTKNRLPFLDESIEQKVHEYTRQQFKDSGCPVRIINGMPDHVHCLFLLNPKKSIAEVIKQVKGSTSHWVNQQEELAQRCAKQGGHSFAWQTGYVAYSVSESLVEKVYQYIKQQNQHHQQRSFQEEYEALLALHALS